MRADWYKRMGEDFLVIQDHGKKMILDVEQVDQLRGMVFGNNIEGSKNIGRIWVTQMTDDEGEVVLVFFKDTFMFPEFIISRAGLKGAVSLQPS